MALQPFGLWPLFQFLNPIRSKYDSLYGGSVSLKVATYTQSNTNTEYMHTDINASSGIRTHDRSVQAGEDGSCLRQGGDCERHNAIITS
jgi:hypothetical protein